MIVGEMCAHILCLLTVALFVLAGCAPRPPKESFPKLAEEFIYTSLANSPVSATQVGYHRHGSIDLDGALDDFGPPRLSNNAAGIKICVFACPRSTSGTSTRKIVPTST